MIVYVPQWFEIKTKSSIVEGPKHISECIKNAERIYKNWRSGEEGTTKKSFLCSSRTPIHFNVSGCYEARLKAGDLWSTEFKHPPTTMKQVRKSLVPVIQYDADNCYCIINLCGTKILISISTTDIAELISKQKYTSHRALLKVGYTGFKKLLWAWATWYCYRSHPSYSS